MSLLVQQGANAFLIRQALGHKSFDSTLASVNPSDPDASAALAKANPGSGDIEFFPMLPAVHFHSSLLSTHDVICHAF